jgi:serine/threonine protein kinase
MSESETPVHARVVAGRYRLVRELGRGGMGVVWLASDELVGRQVAVKELRPPAMLADDERDKYVRRALQEARSAARIHHPGAVTLYDVLPATDGDDAVYLIMELVEGPTLADLIQQRGRLPEAEVAKLGLQLVAVVDAAHALGIVHRDIKPSNILIAPGPQVKLTDFGIAHTLGDPRLTHTGVMGTQAYLAPELFEAAPINPSADVWSLGATLFAAVDGRAPFERDTTGATLRAILFDAMPVPRCSPALAEAITGMLQRDPARRSTLAQARESLLRVGSQPPVTSPEPRPDTRPTASLSPGWNKPAAQPPQRPPATPYPSRPAPPVSPMSPVRYPVPPTVQGPAMPRHAAPAPPGQPTTQPGPPGPRPPAAGPPPPMPRPTGPVGPPAAVATFSNMPDEIWRVLLVVGCVVAIPVVVVTWVFVPPLVYLVLFLVAVAYVVIALVVRSKWCQLTLTSRGMLVGRKSATINWDRITGFGPVVMGSKTYLNAWVVGAGGGPPKPIRICPLEAQHFPPEAIRAAILAQRPGVRIDPLQPSYAYPPRPPYR